MHFGGQAVELESHAPQMGEKLRFVRLLSEKTERVLKALKVEHKVGVLVQKRL